MTKSTQILGLCTTMTKAISIGHELICRNMQKMYKGRTKSSPHSL